MNDRLAADLNVPFRQIVESANEGVWLVDAQGRIVYANEYMTQLLGHSRDELLGRSFLEFLHPEERDSAQAAWRNLQPDARRRLERRLLRSDGALLWAAMSISAFPGAGGGGSLALVTDISEQKRAQEALRESEARYRQIVETASEGILVFDHRFDVLYVNGSMARMLGYAAAEMVGRSGMDFVADSDLHDNDACIERSLRGERQRYPRRLKRKDGSVAWTFVSSTPTDNPQGRLASVLCMITDLSEQKRVEEALRTQERRHQEIVETANEGIWVIGPDARVRYANDCLLRMLGVSRDGIVGCPAFDFFFEEDLEDAQKVWRKTLAGQRSRVERRMRRRDGTPIWVIASVTPTMDEQGRLIRSLGMLADISEQKRVKQRLQDNERALQEALTVHRSVLECSLDVICTFDRDGRFIEVSQNCAGMWGYRREELIGRRVMELVHPEDLLKTEALMSAARATRDFENRCIRKDGSIVPILWSATVSREGGKGYAVAHDLTDWRRAEEKLKHLEKMQAVGELTGGVAHDFNNLLTVILGNASIMLEELEEGHRLRPLAETARRAAERGADLTARLLAFSRRQPLQPQAADVNLLIRSMADILRRTLGEAIHIELLLGEDLAPAWVDPPQLETALLNLCLNARDAMPAGGRLTIETAPVEIPEGGASELRHGTYVAVSVIDTGEGMPAEVAARAIEPFFTTKDVGKGSGLGLSMVYGFVKQSGGHVRIDSEPGRGTAVRLFLPRSAAPLAVPKEAKGSPVSGGGETILLVEDDDLVRLYVETQLRSLGYEIISAIDARSALALIDSGVSIDLLFTDIIMPGGMNGRQLADAARRRRPEMRVLFTSGYSQDVMTRAGKLDEGVALLAKPYRREELAARIRAVLDGPAAEPRKNGGDQLIG